MLDKLKSKEIQVETLTIITSVHPVQHYHSLPTTSRSTPTPPISTRLHSTTPLTTQHSCATSPGPTATIKLRFWPFPQTANAQVLINGITAVVIGIAFSFIPANFIYYTVKEKQIKSKHQQFISGVTPFTYHAAHFIWDFLNYLVPAILCLIVIAIYDIEELIGSNVELQ